MKKAYVIIVKGQKLYFAYTLNGLLAIQHLLVYLNLTISCKVVNVSANKQLLDISDLHY